MAKREISAHDDVEIPELERGYETKLIHPKFAVPYRKNQKNDFNDAEAIAEAASRRALANHNARVVWALLAKKQNYDRYKAA